MHDDTVNILTVIANESYRQYVETYQSEIASGYRSEIEARYGKPIGNLSDEERRRIEEEYGEGILPPRPRRAGEQKAKLRKARVLSEEFKELWDRIKHKTRYAVRINTEALLDEVIPEIDRADIAPPRVTITKASVVAGDDGIFEAMQLSQAKSAADLAGRWPLPTLIDLMADLMENTTPPIRLTRRTYPRSIAEQRTRKQRLITRMNGRRLRRIIKEKLAKSSRERVEYPYL